MNNPNSTSTRRTLSPSKDDEPRTINPKSEPPVNQSLSDKNLTRIKETFADLRTFSKALEFKDLRRQN